MKIIIIKYKRDLNSVFKCNFYDINFKLKKLFKFCLLI